MKLFIEKMSIGKGQRKFKVKINDDNLLNLAFNFKDVEIMTNRNLKSSDTAISFDSVTNNTLYDVDGVQHAYHSANNEDNSFKLPVIRHKDISQFENYDFSISQEVSGAIELPFDKSKFFDSYEPMPNSIISYDSSKFDDIAVDFAGLSEDEIYAELEKVFGSANVDGIDSAFIGTEYTQIHPNIQIARIPSNLPYGYVLETDIMTGQNFGTDGTVAVNLFRTKNHLKNDYNVFINDDDNIVAWRRYKSINKNLDNIWISYSVDFADSSTNEHLTAGYETVEHMAGFAKYKLEETGHKSSIYSIRIHNSGLNQVGDVYTELRKMFEKSLFNLMTKIAPIHNQLWKIEYVD